MQIVLSSCLTNGSDYADLSAFLMKWTLVTHAVSTADAAIVTPFSDEVLSV